MVNVWLAEDAPSLDWGGYVVGEASREAFLLGKGKRTAVLAGVPFVDEIFYQLGCQCVSLSFPATIVTYVIKSRMAHAGGRYF